MLYLFPDYLQNQIQKSGIVGSNSKSHVIPLHAVKFSSLKGISLCTPMSTLPVYPWLRLQSVLSNLGMFDNLLRNQMPGEALMYISLIMNELSIFSYG